MRVVTPAGETIELGTTETSPTIGIVDYSRRVTDDFGVTTVVERGFARRMSVRLAVPFDEVDALQRRLADLRATAARWIADDRFAALDLQGFYKDFEVDLAVPPTSFCTLTIEGLAGADGFIDTGADPAPGEQGSSLQLLQPVDVTTGMLVSSNVAEDDASEWAAGTSYAVGARVIRAATHRVYESLVAANAGNDPAGGSGKWLDVGPTNRWAMFDQALGTSTSQAGSIMVTLAPGAINALALLDVSAVSVRVQAPGYDRTIDPGEGAVTFLDLPGGAGTVTVTITGGHSSVGTLLVGRVNGLGITGASPIAGITDFSRKTVDDFGEVTVVPRAWAKRVSAAALIRSDAVDLVANRIAAVRARPSLWIGQADLDSLTVYGFFRDFSIVVDEGISKLSLSIEGLSTAAKLEPLRATVDWDDVADPTGTKPADHADVTGDNTAKDTRAVGGVAVQDLFLRLDQIEAGGGEDTDGAIAARAASEAARDVSIVARDNAQAARDQSQVARDASQLAKGQAEIAAAASAQRAEDAGGYAQTASGKATIATQQADAAGQSAVIALAGADIASTKAGEASAGASSAAISEANALGSKTAAASSATVSASSAAQSAINANLPVSFAQRGQLYSTSAWGSAVPDAIPDSAFDAGNVFVVPSGVATTLTLRKLLPGLGRAYRVQMKVRSVGAAGYWAPNWEVSTGSATGPTGGTFGGFEALPVASGWVVRELLIDYRAITSFPYVAPNLPLRAAANGTMEVEYFRVIDITEQLAAADSAAASATSAAAAATSKTAAGESASAAQDAVVTASTKAGEASVAAASAATSESNTAGLANTASQSATLAAQAKADAQGSASASAASAAVAGTKATEAGQQASAASQAKLDAEIASGGALMSAGVSQQQAAIATDKAGAASQSADLSAQHASSAGQALASINDASGVFATKLSATAQRASVLEARAPGSGAVNLNPYFGVAGWTGSNPPYWEIWGGARERFGVSAYAGRYSATPLDMGRAAGENVGLSQGVNDVPAGWYVVEAEVELRSGSWRGAGVYVNFGGPELRLHFGTTPDINGLVYDGTAYTRRAWSALVRNPVQSSVGLFALAGWTGLGSIADANLMAWHSCVLRPATAGDLAGIDTAARVAQSEIATADLYGRTSARWNVVAQTPGGRAQLSVYSDSNAGAGVDIVGNVGIAGDLVVNGSIVARKFDRNSMSRIGASSFSGNINPEPGQTIVVPWSLSLGVIPPVGRFIYEYAAVLTSNAGQQTSSNLNGKPLHTNFIGDGGLALTASDGQGHGYSPRPNSSDIVLATADFAANFTASVSRGNYDSGVILDGDYYYRNVSASYTLTRIDLRVTWVAI